MLQNNILPQHTNDDLLIVVIHCDAQARTPSAHIQQFGLTYPIALDFDSELFRRFRLPGQVFPLNVVIDREGRVAHIGIVLDDAVAVAEGLL